MRKPLPKHKAALPPVEIPLQDGKLAEIGAAVIAQTTAGAISPDTGAALMTMLQGQLRVIESEELTQRLERLEQIIEGRAG